MAWQDPNELPDDDDDDYFSEELEGADLTGKEPKFFRIDSLSKSPVELSELRVDDLISTYIAARNQLATDRKGYKAREAIVKTHLRTISAILLNKSEAAGGVDSFKTSVGTAYRKVKETFRVASWDELVAYVKTSGNFTVLQKRVSPNAIKDVREQDGAIPPGVEPLTEIEFAVRSPTASRRST